MNAERKNVDFVLEDFNKSVRELVDILDQLSGDIDELEAETRRQRVKRGSE